MEMWDLPHPSADYGLTCATRACFHARVTTEMPAVCMLFCISAAGGVPVYSHVFDCTLGRPLVPKGKCCSCEQ